MELSSAASWDNIIKTKSSQLTMLWTISVYANEIAPDLPVFIQFSTDHEDLGISPWPFQCRQYVQSLPGMTFSV